MKILLVDDDDFLGDLLTRSLAAYHYVVDTVKDGEMGWTYGSTFDYDLIVLDIMLPKLDGISLCRRFRAEGYTTPILLLTAQASSTAKVNGLDAGADDYVVKPFDVAELSARIRALLRRSSVSPFPLLTWGDLLLNPSSCEVTYNAQPLTLTTKEYELLELFMRESQHVFSTDEILGRLWSSEEFPSGATVRSHIRRVRHKLVIAGAPPDFIATVHGRGYFLKAGGETQQTTLSNALQQDLKNRQTINNLQAIALSQSSLQSTSEQNTKVMIVDDDQYWLKTLPDLLKPWRFKITTLAEPQQFWTVLQSVNPDLLVLEVSLPDMNGFELCQALRRDPKWQRLPILFLSELTDQATQNHAFTLGADDYLCKPVMGIDLANRIRNRLQRVKAWAT
ncbi:MAG: response regulator [Cyanobacteria bacterium CAN_BIN43]|nr:response regulator [Cyanobacteria bacterium CAN_BIN43]